MGKYSIQHGITMFEKGIDIVQLPGEAIQGGVSKLSSAWSSLVYGAGQRAKYGAGKLAMSVKNRKHLKRKK